VRERREVAPRVGGRARDVAAVEVGHAAADLLRTGHLAAVALQHRHRVASDLRLVVVDRAREEERDLLRRGRRGGARPTLAEPAGERLVVEARQVAVAVHADRGLQQHAVRPETVGRVHQRGDRGGAGAHAVDVAQEPVLPCDALGARPRGLGTQHQPREVDVEPVRRRVRAVVETELALPAEVDDAPVVGRRDLRDVALVLVHLLEHEVERRAQAVAPPAAVADLGDARQLLLDRRGVEEGGVARVEGHAGA
jgi:hypothetical protein